MAEDKNETVESLLNKQSVTFEQCSLEYLKTNEDDPLPSYSILHYVISDYIHGFIVVPVWGSLVSKPEDVILYESEEDGGAVGGTEDLIKSDVFLYGSIKWDGCSNWHFSGQENCMLHFCGESRAVLLGDLMKKMYKITADNMERFEG